MIRIKCFWKLNDHMILNLFKVSEWGNYLENPPASGPKSHHALISCDILFDVSNYKCSAFGILDCYNHWSANYLNFEKWFFLFPGIKLMRCNLMHCLLRCVCRSLPWQETLWMPTWKYVKKSKETCFCWVFCFVVLNIL